MIKFDPNLIKIWTPEESFLMHHMQCMRILDEWMGFTTDDTEEYERELETVGCSADAMFDLHRDFIIDMGQLNKNGCAAIKVALKDVSSWYTDEEDPPEGFKYFTVKIPEDMHAYTSKVAGIYETLTSISGLGLYFYAYEHPDAPELGATRLAQLKFWTPEESFCRQYLENITALGACVTALAEAWADAWVLEGRDLFCGDTPCKSIYALIDEFSAIHSQYILRVEASELCGHTISIDVKEGKTRHFIVRAVPSDLQEYMSKIFALRTDFMETLTRYAADE